MRFSEMDLRLTQRKSTGPIGNPNQDLIDLLDVYYKLDEVSGNRADSGPNGLTLTDNNSVTSNAGIVYPLAAEFVSANGTYLYRANSVPLEGGTGSHTISAWVWLDSTTDGLGIVAKASSGGYSEWSLILSGNTLFVGMGNGLNAETNVGVVAGPSTGQWYLITWWYDADDGKLYHKVNGDAVPAGTNVPTIASSGSGFAIGRFGDFAGGGIISGRVGPVAKFHAKLSADQLDRMWNGGAGLAMY